MDERGLAFGILRSALNGDSPYLGTRPIDASTWWSLFRLLQKNHVAALCYRSAAAAAAPRDVLVPWLAEHEKAVGWHRYQAEVQQEIVDAMRSRGIDTLVLKGTHTARYWPQPETREFGDLDLYFYDKHSEADRTAREVLRAEVTNEAHHHSRFDYRGVTVESHYDFVNRHFPPSNRRYDDMLKAMAPSATFEVLFLLRHAAGHFASSRITLRDLVDWALTCRALEHEVDWPLVQRTIDDYGMRPFASALSTVVEKQMGISLPIAPASSLDVDERFERDIVYGTVGDHSADGLGRLGWKMRRWRALGWKRRMVYNDSSIALLATNLTSHAARPYTIMHKV